MGTQAGDSPSFLCARVSSSFPSHLSVVNLPVCWMCGRPCGYVCGRCTLHNHAEKCRRTFHWPQNYRSVYFLLKIKTTTMAVRHCKFEARSHRPYLDASRGDPPSCLSCRDCEFCVPPALDTRQSSRSRWGMYTIIEKWECSFVGGGTRPVTGLPRVCGLCVDVDA